MPVTQGIVYQQVDGYRPLCLDLHVPSVEPRAVCLYLHGGGWRVGSRRAGPGPVGPTSGRLFTRMAERGVMVASADYRLSGEARFPAQLEDVTAACEWLRESYPDTTGLPLVVFGVSAGGTLAALCALNSQLGIKGAVLWYAVSDLLTMASDLEADPYDPSTREAKLLGGPPVEHHALAAAASPITHVHAQMPPFLLLHGSADAAVPCRQSIRFRDAILSVAPTRVGPTRVEPTTGTSTTDGSRPHAGATSPVELLMVDGYDHMFRNMPDAEVEALVDRSVDFLLQAATAATSAS